MANESCSFRVSRNITYDCSFDAAPKTGLESAGKLINRKDIDWAATTFSGTQCTNLSLVSGATAVSLEWIKDLSQTTAEFAANEGGLDGYKHKFAGRVHVADTNSAEFMAELAMAEVIAVVEYKFKGTNQVEAYKIFGLEGLRLSAALHDSNANGAGMTFELTTPEITFERAPFYTWSQGSYAVTKTAFEAL